MPVARSRRRRSASFSAGRSTPTRWGCLLRCRGWARALRRAPRNIASPRSAAPCRRSARRSSAAPSRRAAASRPISATARRLPSRRRRLATSPPATIPTGFPDCDVMPASPPPPLLEVRDLKKHFPIRRGLFSRTAGYVYAVDGVSFTIGKGETLGLVGESGSGKTTAGKAILKLIEPTAGTIRLQGRPIEALSRAEMRPVRREMQVVFQDPFSSLNPRLSVGDIVAEPLINYGGVSGGRAALREQVAELFAKVGLRPEAMARYPHEFSGGQRQRIGIARALALRPKLIVCDEPVSALDVSIQAQVINLLKDLQDELGLTYIFIAHDLSVVRYVSDRVAVMYLGKIAENADGNELYTQPKHPYTGALLSAVPIADPNLAKTKQRIILKGDVPSPINPPSGCRFHPRCYKMRSLDPDKQERCRTDEPELVSHGPGHIAACHFPLDARIIED